jgi:hypothetical protein
MELHLPGPIRSLKDFLTHLGIITLGILIALGLEQTAARRLGRFSEGSPRRAERAAGEGV